MAIRPDRNPQSDRFTPAQSARRATVPFVAVMASLLPGGCTSLPPSWPQTHDRPAARHWSYCRRPVASAAMCRRWRRRDQSRRAPSKQMNKVLAISAGSSAPMESTVSNAALLLCCSIPSTCSVAEGSSISRPPQQCRTICLAARAPITATTRICSWRSASSAAWNATQVAWLPLGCLEKNGRRSLSRKIWLSFSTPTKT